MGGDWFSCQACGQRVEMPETVRYALSAERPGVCTGCGARHVFDASLRLDQSWVREKLDELGRLRAPGDSKGATGPVPPDGSSGPPQS